MCREKIHLFEKWREFRSGPHPLGAAQFIFQSGNPAPQFGYLVLYVLELCIPTQHGAPPDASSIGILSTP
jgi:hypothetical protein